MGMAANNTAPTAITPSKPGTTPAAPQTASGCNTSLPATISPTTDMRPCAGRLASMPPMTSSASGPEMRATKASVLRATSGSAMPEKEMARPASSAINSGLRSISVTILRRVCATSPCPARAISNSAKGRIRTFSTIMQCARISVASSGPTSACPMGKPMKPLLAMDTASPTTADMDRDSPRPYRAMAIQISIVASDPAA